MFWTVQKRRLTCPHTFLDANPLAPVLGSDETRRDEFRRGTISRIPRSGQIRYNYKTPNINIKTQTSLKYNLGETDQRYYYNCTTMQRLKHNQRSDFVPSPSCS